MPVGETLATLVEEVQYELGQSAVSSVGMNFREHIKNRIRREYRRLYHDFDWPDLRVWSDKPVSAGERYYDWPAGLSLSTISAIWYRYGDRWRPLARGIDVSHYNYLDSDIDARADPAIRWRPYGQDQVEIWPMPASDSGTLRFVGKVAFAPLVDEDDRCSLDTDLIVLHVAGAQAAKDDADDAKLLLARAEAHYTTLKARLQTKSKPVNFAAGQTGAHRYSAHFPVPCASILAL